MIVVGSAAERRGGASETNPDKHGSSTSPATKDCRRGECLVTAYCRNALPCAIPDCRDRTPAPPLRRFYDFLPILAMMREAPRFLSPRASRNLPIG